MIGVRSAGWRSGFTSSLQSHGSHGPNAAEAGEEAKQVTAEDIAERGEPAPVLYQPDSLPGVAAECCVAAEEANDHQLAPHRVRDDAVGEEGEKHADQEGAAHVDDAGTPRAGGSEMSMDEWTRDRSRLRPKASPKTDPQLWNFILPINPLPKECTLPCRT